MPTLRVPPDVLEAFLTGIFSAVGMPPADAAFAARATVQTDLWGIDSHGTLRTAHYAMRLEKRAVNPTPKIVNRLPDKLPVAHLDADAALGYIAGRDGVALAIEKARTHGISFVLVSNSNHFGAAGLYARQGAAAGLVTFSTTNVKPNVAPTGAAASATGNNPVALAVPVRGRPPFCIDIAMSLVAQGKLIYAAKSGKTIPEGWALDAAGNPTTDPAAGLKGMLMPVGDHKGFGISLFIDLLTGLLGGGPFLTSMRSMYSHPGEPSELAHAFACLDPGLFLPDEDYDRRTAEWLRALAAVPVQSGRDRLTVPGEPEIEMERVRRADGIPLPPELFEELQGLARRLGVAELRPA